jgi:deazaflavin-dependent oxidoreductase (nitroreductase family)
VKTVRLVTTGRRSGVSRAATLYAFPMDGGAGSLVVVGSRGGSASDPAWAHNLRADANATLTVGGAPRPVRAREADGQERERLWALVCDSFPLYATYQRRTARRIPLFVLEPVADG